jgi:general secretion pathway protein L
MAVLRPGTPLPKRDHVLAVDGAEAPLMPVDLPPRLKGEARLRVARQQIADRLGVAPATIAVMAAGPGRDWTRVVVVDRARLAALAESADRRCRAILPDYLTLPQDGDQAVIATAGDTVMVRLGATEGFSAPLGVAPVVLGRALEAAGLASAAIGSGVPDAIASVLRAGGIRTHEAEIVTDRIAKPPFDLRDALKSTDAHDGFRTWLLAAGIAFVAFGLWAAGVLVETRAVTAELDRVRGETEQVLRRGLLPSGPLLDVRAQVTRAMSGTAEDAPRDDLAGLALLAQVTRLVFERGVAVDGIELDPDLLRISVTAPDFDAAEALANDFRVEGLSSETEVLRARDDGRVEARFKLEAGA